MNKAVVTAATKKGMYRGEPGMCSNMLGQLYPEWIIDPAIGPRGWNVDRAYESHHEVQVRASNVKQWLTTQWQPARAGALAALVIHADFKRVLLSHLLGADEWPDCDSPIWNTALSWLQYDSGTWHMVVWNSADHLPLELRTPLPGVYDEF